MQVFCSVARKDAFTSGDKCIIISISGLRNNAKWGREHDVEVRFLGI